MSFRIDQYLYGVDSGFLGVWGQDITVTATEVGKVPNVSSLSPVLRLQRSFRLRLPHLSPSWVIRAFVQLLVGIRRHLEKKALHNEFGKI